jgi:DNA-binding MarR family transcriptional regulator
MVRKRVRSVGCREKHIAVTMSCDDISCADENRPPSGTAPLAAAEGLLLELVRQTSSAGRALRRLLADEAAAEGLNDAELLVIWLCATGNTPGVVQGELAAAIGVSPALMSGTVERLRSRELIARHRSPIDRRRQVWQTTGLGQDCLARLRGRLAILAATLEQRMTSSQQRETQALCQRLTRAAEAIGTPELPLAGGSHSPPQDAAQAAVQTTFAQGAAA